MRVQWDVHIDMGNYIYQSIGRDGIKRMESIYLNYANKEQWNQFVGINGELSGCGGSETENPSDIER